jgi:hypothetical protein
VVRHAVREGVDTGREIDVTATQGTQEVDDVLKGSTVHCCGVAGEDVRSMDVIPATDLLQDSNTGGQGGSVGYIVGPDDSLVGGQARLTLDQAGI